MPDTEADYTLHPYPEDYSPALDPLVTLRLPRLLLLEMARRMCVTCSGWDSRERAAARRLALAVQRDADIDMYAGAAEGLSEEDDR